jgi:KUP system potassium uptake protein
LQNQKMSANLHQKMLRCVIELSTCCVKYLPVNTVPAEERFRFRRVDPKEYKMYRCVALYGYTDVRVGNVEFETELLESLKEFLQSQYMPRLREIETRASQTFESSQGVENKLATTSDGSGESEVVGMTELELQQNVEFLEESRKSGVVYLLGDSQVSAKSNSRLITKNVVNYAYRFLRRNCRQVTSRLNTLISQISISTIC